MDHPSQEDEYLLFDISRELGNYYLLWKWKESWVG